MRKNSHALQVAMYVALICAFGVAATVLVGQFVRQTNDERLAQDIDNAQQDFRDYVLDRLAHYQYGLRGARGAVLVAGDGLNHGLFLRYMQSRQLGAEFPGSRGFGYIQRVAGNEVDAFVKTIRAEGQPDFALSQIQDHPGERFIVRYLEPASVNKGGIGFDIASESSRHTAAVKAMHSATAQLTGPIVLHSKEPDPSSSVLFLMPVYRSASPPEDPVAREADLTGWTFTPLIIRDVLASLAQQPAGQQLSIRDVSEEGQGHALFVAGPAQGDVPLAHRRSEDIDVYGRRWRFELAVGQVYVDTLQAVSPSLVSYIGGAFTMILAILGVFIGAGVVRRDLLMRDQLRLAAIVASSTDGIIGKDLDGVVTSWNKGAQTMFGYTAQEAVGQRLETLIIPADRAHEEEEILDRLRQGYPVSNLDTIRHRRDGSLLEVSVNISPIIDSRGHVEGASKTVRDISQEKQAQATIAKLNANLEEQVAERTVQLKESNLMLRSVLQSATDVAIIATDRDGLIQIFNPGAERMLGYAAQELVGDVASRFFDPAEASGPHAWATAENPREPVNPVFRVLTSRSPDGATSGEGTFVRKDGGRVPVALMVSEVRNDTGDLTGYLGIALDITQCKTAEEALTATRDQLLLAAQVMQLGIWSWDVSTDALQWNDQMFELYAQPVSLRDQGVKYQHWLERIHPQDQVEVEQRLEAALRGEGEYDQAFRVLGPHGQLRMIQARAWVEHDATGRPIRVTGVNLDITAQRELQANLQLAKEQADAASAAKSSFLANISHEIRTPMNAVLGMLQLLQHTLLDDRQSSYVRSAHVAGKSLLGLLNDVLDYSKIEAQKLELQLHAFHLQPLLDELAIILEGNKTSEDVHILFQVDSHTAGRFLGDEVRLKQVLINLAGNAMKFTHHGEVIVRVIRLQSTQASVRLRFEVEDSGIGMRAEDLEHIFLSFSQAQASQTRHYGGTGLGLAICKRLVELMGGQLQVRSQLGVGSCFWFEIDLQVDHAPVSAAAQRATVDSVGGSSVSLAGVRILVVEDNPVNRLIIVELLKHVGAEVEEVQDGAQAIARLRREPSAFHAVLMDIQMPGIDGYEVTRRLRADERFHHLPIIAMTANASGSDQASCLAAGMNAHLSKPIDFPQVLATLKQWTGSAQVAPPGPMSHRSVEMEPLAAITARFGGNVALLNKMLRAFEAELGTLGEALQGFIDTNDQAGAKRVLHSIKGVAGNLGAVSVSAMANNLEHSLGMQQHPMTAILTPQALTRLGELIAVSAERLGWFISKESVASPREGLTVTEFRDRLKAIVLLLDDNNLEGVTLVEALAEYDLPCPPALWNRLLTLLDKLDFRSAALVARELLS